MAVVFILAATYSYFIGSKGFAGFDLSPMISLAQSLHQGNSYHDFIDNPFSPGFALILKIFSQIFGGVNWNTFTLSVILLSGICIYTASYYHFKSNYSNKFIFYAFFLGALIPLITDGHLYLHDASNVIAIFSTFLLYVIINNSYYEKYFSF